MLSRLSEYLGQFDVLITYNGKSFDQPLLEGRYHVARAPHPFGRLPHLDLLFGARRLWKLRLESCRLENQILGVEREGDLPGEMIPYCYLEFLRTRQAFELIPIFHHNALDILSLACLTSIVPFAFRSPDGVHVRHGADLIGLARWLLETGRQEESLALFRRAVDMGLPDHLLFRTLWDVAALERRCSRTDASLAVLTDLAAARNPYRVRALAELAKHYEHIERNYSTALEMTQAALELEDTPELRRREERLRNRLASPRGGRVAVTVKRNRRSARLVTPALSAAGSLDAG
jgi:tetratricopeptide (TPR) repeat protein